MAQYIDKTALVAEIENLRKHYLDREEYDFGWNSALDKIISILDALEVKEVNLEKEIDEVIHNYKVDNHRHTSICSADIEWIAEHFFEFGLNTYKEEHMKQKIITRPFNEVFSQEEIDAVDKKILEAQEKERKRLEEAWTKVKDFPMNN